MTNSTPGCSIDVWPGPRLIPYRGRFDGFHALPASVSKTCLVRFDDNKYSVNAGAVGRPVETHAYADRVAIRQDGRPVAEYERTFGRGKILYDPWQYVPLLACKPGAPRNGAPFRDWVLPGALERIRRRLAGSDDGDRQIVKILAAVLTDGLSEVEAPRRWARASIPPTSFSIFWRGAAIRVRSRPS